MLQAPEGSKVVSFHGVVTRADGTVEDLGLIDHSHPWLFTEHELRALAHNADQFELLWERARAHLPGAVIIPTGSASIEGGKGVFANQIGGGTSTPPQYIAFGQGYAVGTRITALTTDLVLANEIGSIGGTNTNTGQSSRVTGSLTNVTTTNLDDTVQVVGTITAGTALTVNEAGLFTTSAFPGQATVATITSTFLNGALTSGGSATVGSSTGLPTSEVYWSMVTTGSACEVFQATLTGTTLACNTRGQNGTTAAAAASAGIVLTVATPTGTGGAGLCAAKGDFANIGLATNDTLALTAKVQLT